MSILKWSYSLPILLLASAGCHTRPPAVAPARAPSAVTAPAPAPPPAPPRPVATSAAPRPLSEAEVFERTTLDELNAAHPLGDVFFDYNQDTLRDEARKVLQRDAQWLSTWPQTRIRIDGHCDERGTEEYNIALGDQRATTVREYLTSLGVNPERIQTRSLGKEAPFCLDSGESCWSQNRRGHFVITAK